MKHHIKTLLAITLLLLLTACGSGTESIAEEKGTSETNATVAVSAVDESTIIDVENENAAGESSDDDGTGTIISPNATLKSLTLTVEKNALNRDENTTVKVMAAYDNGSSKDITDKVIWVATPGDAVKVTNATLTALQDKSTTLKAKLNNKTSNEVKLNITWVVNGHVLPPEPDPVVNNSTLLGIDSNDNGVRDDVERWIYEMYKDKHPIHIDIAMQAGRAYKQVLETPERAKEIREVVNAPIHCNWYYKGYAKYFNEPLLVKKEINPAVHNKYFNTRERQNVYWQYDTLLSGGVYDLPEIDSLKTYCDFNTSKYEK